jgi:hypothetical protein
LLDVKFGLFREISILLRRRTCRFEQVGLWLGRMEGVFINLVTNAVEQCRVVEKS